ncbi:RdgB/HAM1 family non-canonical purine NTP pyrophosphatase [Spiractinospora alimapuensis]|uniref:RdgB/HAM1 family non-canonical purine NTP pyrophosphatase n=1 Tax=Spiractinospora alimapuensis TaxID=2820884 RepID=UPI001EEC1DEF|nr:RdgB/HAM1 family non-canonical purine NTP pyrophosphatase [Spiractinospora alimapuensis]QVQ54181.1 RdgB/HAM1 family non-canonical purine NTP pyrophosphatase [Spiractinospora alimapuensis]
MTELVLSTRNRHKVDEVEAILGTELPGVRVVGLDGLPDFPEVVEFEPTFAGNALLKARAAATALGRTALADDSGLRVDALNGMPGVLSARWSGRFGAGTDSQDRANMNLVLDQLSDTPDDRRGAAFVCAAAVVTPDGHEHTVEGVLPGVLLREPRGTNGFGYDPIFLPERETRTTAEMRSTEKNAISHRRRAFRLLAEHLRAHGVVDAGA